MSKVGDLYKMFRCVGFVNACVTEYYVTVKGKESLTFNSREELDLWLSEQGITLR